MDQPQLKTKEKAALIASLTLKGAPLDGEQLFPPPAGSSLDVRRNKTGSKELDYKIINGTLGESRRPRPSIKFLVMSNISCSHECK